MNDFSLPTVHLNGTSRRMLSEGYSNAYTKLQQAIAAFQGIEFNARDYYVTSVDAWPKARTERDIIAVHFRHIREYLEAHLIHLGE